MPTAPEPDRSTAQRRAELRSGSVNLCFRFRLSPVITVCLTKLNRNCSINLSMIAARTESAKFGMGDLAADMGCSREEDAGEQRGYKD